MADPDHKSKVAGFVKKKVGNLKPVQARANRLQVTAAYAASGQLRRDRQYADLCKQAEAMFKGLESI